MLLARLSLFTSLALVVSACGGSVGAGDQGGPGGPGGPGGGTTTGPGPLGVEGSFDLTFDQASASFQGGGPSLPAGTQPPSLTIAARLDVRKSPAGGYEAVLTPRWGTPSSYSVALADDAMTLTGTGGIGAASGTIGGVFDEWSTLTLPRNDGKLTGEVRGTGKEHVGEGDEIWEGDLTGKGKIVADRTSPELRSNIKSRSGPDGTLLPWDPIVVEAAEPVTASGIEEQTSIAGDHGDSLTLRWEPRKDASDWPGITSSTGHVDDWTRAMSGEPWALSNAGALARDLVGLSASSVRAPLKFLRLGSPTKEIGFDDDVLEAASWGAYAVYGGGLAGTNDPRCESGGCMRIGPFDSDACGVARAGFAGQLQRLPLGHVELRYRVLAKPKYDGEGAQPTIYGDVVTLELASPKATTEDTGVRAEAGTLSKLAAPIDGLTYASAWTTLDVPAPGSDTIGVAVIAGGPGLLRGDPCGGPPPPPVTVEILVERVASK